MAKRKKPVRRNPLDSDMGTEAKRIGRRIREIRMEREMSQGELGELLGLTADRIQKYENGVSRPKDDMLKRIAAALDVSVFALADPVVSSYIGVMYALFEMEDLYDIYINKEDRVKDAKIGVFFEDKAMNKLLHEWQKARIDHHFPKPADPEIDEKDALERYNNWKWNFPNSEVVENCGFSQTYQEEKEIQRKIDELQEQLKRLRSGKE